MLKSYLLIAWRNLVRNKVLSLINIAGLSIGLACCMLIVLYTKDEVSFDRFHAKKDQLYRLTCHIIEKDGRQQKFGIAHMIEGPSFKAAIPEIKEFTRVSEEDFIVKHGQETFNEKAIWADNNFFSVFSFPLVAGNADYVLKDIHSLVITDEMAMKYFGTKDAVGKTLEFNINNRFEPFTVTGIAKKTPQNSTIQFGMVLPFKYYEEKDYSDGWLWLSYPTFFVMDANINQAQVGAKMQKVFETKAKDQIAEEAKRGSAGKFNWGVQPFLQMHMDTETKETMHASDPIYSYILGGIAIFILLIACINFINLAIAQSLKRSKEIGIRKVIGGQRKQLIRQFLGESFLLCAIAFLLAVVLAQLTLPLFNRLANKQLSLGYLLDIKLVLSFTGLFIITALAAGFYPAMVLSGFNPVSTLYNRMHFSGKNYLSKSLVVVQFALATFLIITTLFIYSQFNYLTLQDLGYNDKNLMELSVGQGRNQALMNRFKEAFSRLPGIAAVAPRMNGEWETNTRANGKEFSVRYEHIDEDYLPALNIPLVAGRNFSKDFPADSAQSVLVNEAYVKAAGWKDAVGKNVDFLNGGPAQLKVVGVVKDYHYASLKEKISPQLFSASLQLPFGKFMIRIHPASMQQTIAAIEKVYRELAPNRPFQYDFKDELNYAKYEAEQRWKQIITLSAILTIFISCIGLFGLTTLSVQKRTKEIGVRKVLGANTLQLSAMVSKNFVLLVLLAFLLAIPAAWFAVGKWLQNFAYRIDMHWWVFALAALITVVIALITVSFQSIKAAMANPVKTLRTE